MHTILKKYKTEIKKYCSENNLSSDNVINSYHAGNASSVYILQYDENKKYGGGLANDTVPCPVTLQIFLENGKLRFEQTDITHKYLGAEKDAAPNTEISRPARSPMPTRQKLAYA